MLHTTHQLLSFHLARQHWQVLHARAVNAATGIVAFAARGWGKTAVSLHLAAQAAIAAAPGDTSLWLTPVADQGRAAWRELRRRYRRHLHRAQHTAARLEWTRAGALEFRSAFEPDHLRGKTYRTVILDEASLLPADAWTACIRPTQRRSDDWFVLLTTPRGRDWVWGISKEREDGGSKERQDRRNEEGEERRDGENKEVTTDPDPAPSTPSLHPSSFKIQDSSLSSTFRFPAVWTDDAGVEQFASNVDPARVRAARRETPSAVFAQEYLCEFGDPAAVCFKNVAEHIQPLPAELPGDKRTDGRVGKRAFTGPFVIGVDWGFAHDFTVACAIDLPTARVVDFFRTRRVDSEKMIAAVAAMARKWDGAFCLCDVTSLQDQALSALRKTGAWTEGFIFTAESKTNLIEELLVAWEARRVVIPDFAPLIEEFKTFEAGYTPATRKRQYNAAPGPDNHDDCIIALALAWWAQVNYPGAWRLNAARLTAEPNPIDWDSHFA